MPITHIAPPALKRCSHPAWCRLLGGGLVYWLVFLLVLEPDNLRRASQSGHPLPLDHEALRIAVAAMLGASVTPLLARFVQHAVPLSRARWRHSLRLGLQLGALSLGLVLLSCVLAAWVFDAQAWPQLEDVARELHSNGLLLVYALGALAALLHVLQPTQATAAPSPSEAALNAPDHTSDAYVAPHSEQIVHIAPLTHVILSRAGQAWSLDLCKVDWIETQGNYLALHVGASSHLHRETLTQFEAQLDPRLFVRIHRRMMVSLAQVQQVRPLGNGDALLLLRSGQELRISRSHRQDFMRRWKGGT